MTVNEVLCRLQELLFPSIRGTAVVAVRTDDEALRIEAPVHAARSRPPDCNQWTGIHRWSRYAAGGTLIAMTTETHRFEESGQLGSGSDTHMAGIEGSPP
ncbi:hypothetical protein ABT124_40645 [Streptomyces sp. NPDC001982]|uniref:hypothetical protein n=1 Tax=Streptomyces sp. NPDC001982 TaxID=3154405 RepID=UPI003326060B